MRASEVSDYRYNCAKDLPDPRLRKLRPKAGQWLSWPPAQSNADFQETGDSGCSVSAMEGAINYANHATIVSAFQLLK